MSGIDNLPVVLWFAGASWDEVRGTDRRLVDELAKMATVFWCDPPRSAWRYERGELTQATDEVARNVTRIRTRALPLSSKPGLRDLTLLQTGQVVRREIRRRGLEIDLQVVASPRQHFVSGLGGTKIFYQTDDWMDGASLMNLSAHWMAKTIGTNYRSADVVAAVSDVLVKDLADSHPQVSTARHVVLPNGCYTAEPEPTTESREAVAGLVGQLNERLDLDMIEAVVAAGIPLRVLGPRTDRDKDFGKRLDRILSAPLVEYLGTVAATDVPRQLARMGVGITPYTATRFNRASFPLKTLEYLAAGLAVVSTDLPAVRWLDTGHIDAHSDAAGFASATRAAVDSRNDLGAERARKIFAGRHTWSERAQELLTLAAGVPA